MKKITYTICFILLLSTFSSISIEGENNHSSMRMLFSTQTWKVGENIKGHIYDEFVDLVYYGGVAENEK